MSVVARLIGLAVLALAFATVLAFAWLLDEGNDDPAPLLPSPTAWQPSGGY